MKKKQWTLIPVFLLMAAIGLTACTGNSSKSEAEPPATTVAEAATTEAVTTKTATAGSDETTQMVNPMKKVTSSDDFETIGLSLSLPNSESWCDGVSHFIIDGKVAQISFHDAIVSSDAVVRAGKEDLEDFSGVYYKFDDTKEFQWEATAPSGDIIPIRIQLVIDGSDIPGVLATWSYKGTKYTLWEDEGKHDPASVAKLAMEIAVNSIP